jgi:hypothetical protein
MRAAPAAGPLRVLPTNPRYFTDGTKNAHGSLKAVYLTGAHTWNNLVDMGKSDPPAPFDFTAYLNFLDAHSHNCIRLWTWDSVAWDSRANGKLGKDFGHYVAPLPWARTGPGNALDVKPKFDLTKFNPAYFDRLRMRVTAAAEDFFLNVMQLTDSRSPSRWPVRKLDAGERVGCIIKGPEASWVVLMRRDGRRSSEPMTFILPGDKPTHILVTDLVTGEWHARREGSTETHDLAVGEDSSAAWFEGPAGTWTLFL